MIAQEIVHPVISFFFRPSPSRLSPGRNTVFVPLNELCIVQQHPSLGSLKRAQTITQSKKSSLGCKQRTKGQNNRPKTDKTSKKQTHNTKKNKPTNKKHKTPRNIGRALSKEGSLCADELKKDLQKAITQPTSHHSKIALKVQKQTTDQQCRNPGSPQPGSRRSHCEAHWA